MNIDLDNTEYVVDLIAKDLPYDKNNFIDDWLNHWGPQEVSGWEFVEGPTTYEGFPAREITVLWDPERRNEEPMMIVVVAKKPNDWAKGYVYLTNGRLKDYNGRQFIVKFRLKVGKYANINYSMQKETDYDKVQAMLEYEERKLKLVIPQSINKTVIL